MKELLLSALTTLTLSFAGFAAKGADDSGTAKLSREAVHSAIDACMRENNITRPDPGGERPSEEQRAVMDACLKTKGVDISQRRGPRHYPPRVHKENCNQETETAE